MSALWHLTRPPAWSLCLAIVLGVLVALAVVRYRRWRQSIVILRVGGPLAFAPDGKQLAALDSEGRPVLVETASARAAELARDGPVLDGPMRFSPDGQRLVACILRNVDEIESGGIVIVDTLTSSEIEVRLRAPRAFAFSGDSHTLLVGDVEGAVHAVDVLTGRSRILIRPNGSQVDVIATSPYDDLAAVAWDGQRAGDLRIVRTDTGAIISKLPPQHGVSSRHPLSVADAAFGPDRETLAVCYGFNVVVLWDNKWRVVARFIADSCSHPRFSRGGAWLVVPHADNGINDFGRYSWVSIWDVKRGRREARLPLGFSQVWVADVSADARYVAAFGSLGWPVGHGSRSVLWRVRR